MDRIPDHIEMDPQEGITRRLVLLREGPTFDPKPRVQLFGDGAMLKEIIAATDFLQIDFDVTADVWSITNYTDPARASFAQDQIANSVGPIIVVTDDAEAVPDQIRALVGERRCVMLGTDGLGRSASREAQRTHFEIDRHHIVVAALKALANDGLLRPGDAERAVGMYGVDTESSSC